MTTLNSLTWLKGNGRLLEVVSKLSRGIELDDDESMFCLSVAVILIKEFERDKRRFSYLEFGYDLILSYSLQSGDYDPLFDVSTNLGFYPISKFVLDNGLVSGDGVASFFVDVGLDKFKYKSMTETLEQNRFRHQLVEGTAKDSCYIAPTSFGKSSMMVELISAIGGSKVFVVVPTKSLLNQTYRLINSEFPNRKVIFHDEMYGGEGDFIAVFTQERALRLLKSESSMLVDALLVDEAHNLFESSSRSVLLSRLIRRVRSRNKKSRIFYFSPLIGDSDNLKFEEQQDIDAKRIQFNVKEADVSEYRLDGGVYKYNRFLDEFFFSGSEEDLWSYVSRNQKSNNFIYLRAPRKVESFAGLLASPMPFLMDEKLDRLAEVISKNVHEDFYCVDLVRKGVVYIHGKLPDLVKEYLEFKFREIESLKFVVANSVILEGVNLPVDNLYILNTYSLGAKELTNLIGRVNRLNEVFAGDNPSLAKLKPSVHFVNSEEFNKVGSNMSNKIKLLKTGRFNDEVKNPTLINFDITKYDRVIEGSSSLESVEIAKKARRDALSVIEREGFLAQIHESDDDKIKSHFLESGLNSIYFDYKRVFDEILKRLSYMKGSSDHGELDPIEMVYLIFIFGLEDEISDLSFVRLKNERARNYYRSFVRNIHMLTLKEHIDSTVKFFYRNAVETGNNLFYIGSSYGEVARDGSIDANRTYIDLSTKSHKELVNLALVKLKMEGDFLSYKLNEFVFILKECGVLSEDEYNVFIYGTAKKRNTDLTKLGLSGAIINKLEFDGQIENIEVDKLGHVLVNDEFRVYLGLQDDFVRFEINKYIVS